ncbi:hypothetical protein AUC47_10300 [Microbacterium sp. SZ1]|nr:hypothetical protein AUC47_10300 [Microbacterium sp. SZ1]
MLLRRTGIEEIDSRLREVHRRAEVDIQNFESTPDAIEALSTGANALNEIARGIADLRPFVRAAWHSGPPEIRPELTKLDSFSLFIDEVTAEWRQTELTYAALADARRSAYEAAEAASALKSAAGDAGAMRLEEAFTKYANGERRSAQIFRSWTIALLGTVAMLGGVLAVLPFILATEANTSWQEVVYRASVLTALAALAAYLGRQSGNHRRAAAWADAIAVQLQAFPAFIQPIQGGKVADEIYEAFGKRVMSSPPEFSGKSDEAVNPTMTALIDALVKQARPTS